MSLISQMAQIGPATMMPGAPRPGRSRFLDSALRAPFGVTTSAIPRLAFGSLGMTGSYGWDDTDLSVDHGKVGAPRADRVTILLRHHTRDLRDVAEVVRDPRGEQLPQRDRAEVRMFALERE